jgi:hypothetical protein
MIVLDLPFTTSSEISRKTFFSSCDSSVPRNRHIVNWESVRFHMAISRLIKTWLRYENNFLMTGKLEANGSLYST